MSIINTSCWARRVVAVLVAVGVGVVGGGSAAHADDAGRALTDGFETQAASSGVLVMTGRTTIDDRPADPSGMVQVGPTAGSSVGALSPSSSDCTKSDENACVQITWTTLRIDSLSFRLAPDGSVHDASATGRVAFRQFTKYGAIWLWGDEDVVDAWWSVRGRHHANGDLVLNLGTDIGVNAQLVFEPLGWPGWP